METIEAAAIRDEVWPLFLEYLPHGLIRPFRMGMQLGVSDAFVGQPGVQFIDFAARVEAAGLVVTLTHEMRRRGVALGVATMCIGIGQGIATVIEQV